mmetsp:Transcript_7262/g.15640  ORF Transcript_7262/g.15640 Transcript_7262/m.15640 type:complete len:1243 (-) Transcript_7262:13-3741(-)
MKSQKHHERYRGITNSQGTACHTSSALQLIFHCFPNVRDKLLDLAVATSDASVHAHDENNDSKNNEARNISSDELSSSKKGVMIMQQEFVYRLAWFFYLLKHARHVHTTKESSQRRKQGNYEEISPKVGRSGTKSNSTDRRMSKTSKRQLISRQQAAIVEFMSSVRSQRSIRKNLKNSNLSSSGTVNAAAETEKVEEINQNNDMDEKHWNAIKEEKWRALVEIMREEEKLERLRQLKEQKQKERVEQKVMKIKNSKQYRESLHNVLDERSSESCASPAFIGASTSNEGRKGNVNDENFVNSYERAANRSNQTLSGALSQSAPQHLTPPTSPARSSSHSHRPPNHNYHISTNDPIDPSEFYLYLTQYTTSLLESPSKGNKKGIIRIDTNNVADAATIFRCLVSTLEFSVTRELDRLNEVVRDMQHVEEEGKFSEGESWLQPILGLLSQLKKAMQYEWNGVLISRIVGTRAVASDDETPNDNSDATSPNTIIQRSKRNGNIERPIPVPFPLPVINQRSSNSTDPRSESDKNGEGRNYFPSLVDSLHSITIEPNPIRGYDWTSMMKRGDVIEKKIVRHAAVVNRAETNPSFQAGRANARTDRAVSNFHRDGINFETEEIVRTMEAMDMVETNMKGGIMGGGRREEGETDESNSTSKRESTLTILSDNGIAATNSTIYSANSPIEKDAYYAAAVARLVARPQSRRGSFSSSRASSTSRRGNTRFRDSSFTIRDVASSSNSENPTSNVPVSPLLSPGADSFSGMEVGGIPADAQVYSSSDQGITMTYMPSPTNSFASSTDSDSEEESSVDSQVSSVQDSDSTPSCIDDDDPGTVITGDGSSETHSSAIETPSDIDELSLGSFTDDSLEENDVSVTKRAPPPVPLLGDETTHNPARETERPNTVPQVNTSIQTYAVNAPDLSQPGTKLALEAKSKAVEPAAESKTETLSNDSSSDTSSDSDSSSASSSDDDSTSTSESDSDASTSYTSNSSSDDSSATKSSDSSDEKGVPFRSGVGDQQQHVVTWVTRKETRFRHPLPESLIFHLKRFEYSTPLGRVEKLCGLFHVPEEIDLSACCLEQRENVTCIDSAKNERRICPCGDQFRLTGAIVHVDPLDDDEELAYGDIPEGHYVSYISQPYYSDKNDEIKYKWIEIDDDRVRSVHHHNSNIIAENGCASSVDYGSKYYSEGQTNDVRAALKIIDGCDTYVSSGRRLRAAAKKAPVNEKERRYAYLVVYSRICCCNNRKSNA